MMSLLKRRSKKPKIFSRRHGAIQFFSNVRTCSLFSRFKLRGAFNKMARLSHKELKRGVIAASAGAIMQGVALAARTGCEATIVMPVTTPAIKISAVRRLGGQGGSFRRIIQRCLFACPGPDSARRALFLFRLEDPDVIAGRGAQ